MFFIIALKYNNWNTHILIVYSQYNIKDFYIFLYIIHFYTFLYIKNAEFSDWKKYIFLNTYYIIYI